MESLLLRGERLVPKLTSATFAFRPHFLEPVRARTRLLNYIYSGRVSSISARAAFG